jgi:vacuolar protein sorting-associated protein 29
MLILAIGDLHIPYRTTSLPPKFKKLLSPGKISQVLCLGNSTSSSETLDYLKQLSPDFQQVKGQFDSNAQLPTSLVVTHGNWRIGFTNGFSVVPENDSLSLLTLARQMNVDVLIWGGESGKVEAYGLEGKFFVNPGSATGAMGLGWEDVDVEEEEEEAEKEEEGQDGSAEKKDGESDTTGDQKANDKQEAKDTKPEENEEESEEEEGEFFQEDELYDTIPSFTLLDIQGKVITLYIYTYINGEVKVDKVSYRKDEQQ